MVTEKMIEALKPLADAVFNDNGDMTVQLPAITSEDCIKAYFAVRELAALSTDAEPVKLATDKILAQVAAIICEETCGLTSQCKSREAAKALFDKGYLSTPPAPSVAVKALEDAFKHFKVVYQPPNGVSINEATARKAIEIAASALSAQVQDVAGYQDSQSAKLWPGQNADTVIKEMQNIATGEYDGYEDTFDPWTADNRADIDRWQSIISDTLPAAPAVKLEGKL